MDLRQKTKVEIINETVEFYSNNERIEFMSNLSFKTCK